ncbi:MAG: HAMP domain-containing sensor histidine kinase, partial [Dehalococcoidia bacterium]|nr:HAMP domain-containing sensor histidine kinase [Dehalococcoidia bacterium]
ALRITGESLSPQLQAGDLEPVSRRLAVSSPYVQVLDTQGSVILTSPNLQGQPLPVDPGVVLGALQGQPSASILPAVESQRVRVHTTPIIHGDKVVGVIQVGQSLYSMDSSLQRLVYFLALGVLGTWALFSLGGWLMAGRALRPLTQISNAAERIGATGDFGQRIAYAGPRDELGNLTATFNQMIQRIQKAFDAQRQFVADASHELGTPLTVIRGNLDLLKRDLPQQDLLESRRSMEGEAARMDRIIGDLLTLAQMEGQEQDHYQPINIEALVRDAFHEAQLLGGKRRIALGAMERAMVTGDAHQLGEAIFNLVDNAIKYTSEKGSIALSVRRSGQWVQVGVADTGIGIPEDELPRIFDRFYRVDKAHSRAKGGTGLGLAIVKAIAEAYGGRVTVESTPDKGSVFTLWLPVSNPPLISP